MTELPVRMEAHVKVVSQTKDITVFVPRASPQLTVRKVFATNGWSGAWMILLFFILVWIFHLFIIIVSTATRRLGVEQEENIIEKRKKRRKKRREKEREWENKKKGLFISVGGLIKDCNKMSIDINSI